MIIFISLSIIGFGLTLGYIIQTLVERGTIQLSMSLDELRKLLQKIALLVFNPIAFLGAIWIIKLDNLRIAALPFIGVFALLLGGVLAHTWSTAVMWSWWCWWYPKTPLEASPANG